MSGDRYFVYGLLEVSTESVFGCVHVMLVCPCDGYVNVMCKYTPLIDADKTADHGKL